MSLPKDYQPGEMENEPQPRVSFAEHLYQETKAELISEQADYAVLAERHIEAIKALGNIRKMIAGRGQTNTIDDFYWMASALFDEIAEQCEMILEAGDE